MKLGIIGAMKVEMDGLKAAMTETQSVTYSGVEYISGKIGGVEVVAAMSGVGKVFAAVCAQTMIMKFGIDAMVNIGVGGTLTSELNVLEKIIAHDGEMFGASAKECGNYRCLSLDAAKNECKTYLEVLKAKNTEGYGYPQK